MIVGGGFLTQLLSAVTGVISARMLGVEGRGQVVLVASLAMLTSQLTLGGSLPNAVTRQLADRGVTARDGLRHLARRWVGWSVLPAAIAGGYLLFLQRHDAGSAKYALAVGVMITAIQVMMSRILVGAMLGEGADLIHVAMTSVLPQGVTTVVIATAFGFGVRWNAVEITAVTIVCVGVVLVARLRLLAAPTGRAADVLDGRELWGLARRTHIGSVGPIDGLAIDRTLVGSLLGSVQLGLYSAAWALAGLTTILGGCLAMVVLPRVTVAQKDPTAERRLVRRWLLMSAVLISAVVAVLDVGAHAIIKLTFGASFVAAAAAAHWLLVGSGLLDFRRVLIAVLQGRNHGGRASLIELSLTPFVVLGIVLASRRHSLVGVGMTMAGVGLVSCLALGVAVLRSRPGGPYAARHARSAQRRAPARSPGATPLPPILATDGPTVEAPVPG